jgi:lipoic acid synthetase
VSGRLPLWFKQKLPDPRAMARMASLVENSGLHTICENALCPNSGECFSSNTATFLVLGDTCTRHCNFCAVKKGAPAPVDPKEPEHVLSAARALGLRYAVVTSVTRDDLPDGGASHFANVVETLHGGGIFAEVLVPDFQGTSESLSVVVGSRPEVINHNVETVPRLYGEVRPGADYRRSLHLLASVKEQCPGIVTKSGLMVGLGESHAEVVQVMNDLRQAGCDLITIGQYLRPTLQHHPVLKFVTPEEFDEYAMAAGGLGFAGAASGPLVRSSYHAAEMFQVARSKSSMGSGTASLGISRSLQN